MESTFLTAVHIRKVRHLENIDIVLSSDMRKNLILTGKNGSGKTSVLEAMVKHFDFVTSDSFRTEEECIAEVKSKRDRVQELGNSDAEIRKREIRQGTLKHAEELLSNWTNGVTTDCPSFSDLREKYKAGKFVLACYNDNRHIEVNISKNIVKVDLMPIYSIQDSPGRELVKYMVNLKATQAFSKDHTRIQGIESWFNRFQNTLRTIFNDPSLELRFNEETFQFSIQTEGREPFDFNTMSMGYASIFDIIGDLMMRMETKSKGNYDLEGVVLIDEIETHLHVDLQKKIVPILTQLFPNLQFILTTHSPFILNSTQNAVVYDLETHQLVRDGLVNLPYEGIVEGYFGVDLLSQELKEKFEKYRQLAEKPELSDADYAEAAELELYLEEIPDYLALDLTTEYQRLKQKLDNRG